MPSKQCRVCGKPSGMFPYCRYHKPAPGRTVELAPLVPDIDPHELAAIVAKLYPDLVTGCLKWGGELAGDTPILGPGRLVTRTLYGTGNTRTTCGNPDCLAPAHTLRYTPPR